MPYTTQSLYTTFLNREASFNKCYNYHRLSAICIAYIYCIYPNHSLRLVTQTHTHTHTPRITHITHIIVAPSRIFIVVVAFDYLRLMSLMMDLTR